MQSKGQEPTSYQLMSLHYLGALFSELEIGLLKCCPELSSLPITRCNVNLKQQILADRIGLNYQEYIPTNLIHIDSQAILFFSAFSR